MDREQALSEGRRSVNDRAAPAYLNLVGGAWRKSASGQVFADINPADISDVVGSFQDSESADAEAAVKAAAEAFGGWRRTPLSARARILERAAARLEEHEARFGEEMTREQGKPLALSRGEFRRAAATLRFYAAAGQSFGGEALPSDDARMEVSTRREPLGVVAVITPWNFPVSIPSRKIAPALIAGNTVVFKPASDAPLSGYRLTEALVEAELPPGVLNFVTGKASAIGPTITGSSLIRAISFTGSTAAGRQIHRSAGFTTRLQMEMGGKNPLIVMDDADLDQAADLAVKGGLSLSGQACTGTSRIIVIESVADEFTNRLLARVLRLHIGNGLAEDTKIGPIATEAQLRTVLEYVEIGKGEARLLCGGERLQGEAYERGYFVSPAIFTDVTPDMRIAREEVFGPLIAILTARNYAEAIAIANDSEYGLSGAIATRDAGLMHDFINDIECGTVKVNRPTTGNLINAPFGGFKNSSTSTYPESGRAALEFYTRVKTVYRGC
ncbi:MAG: aldehyde dehydrogenase family protein [Acetobacteraceae bacterium]